MKYSVEISKDAKEDLFSIYRHIAHELLVKDIAHKQIQRLEKAILSLDVMPARYRVYDSSKWSDLHMMGVNNYCVFYKINDATQEVNIVRVLYDGRNFDTIFNRR